MGIFEDIYIKARSGVLKIGDKANKVWDISKYKIEIAEKKNEISDKYRLVGKYVYDIHKTGDNFDIDDVTDWLEDIDNLKLYIKECEEKISRIQDKEICSYCKSKNDSGSRFCSNCGRSMSKLDESKNDNNNDISSETIED